MPPASSSSSAATSVQVALRIRPTTTQDSTSIPARFQRSVIQTTSSTSVSIESPSGTLTGTGAPSASTASPASGPKKQSFTFDQVHGPPSTQFELFEATAKPLVSRFLEGFNCTILAYGQTSSGKTHTMTGFDLDADPSDPNNGMGIVPRAVSTIFSRAKQLKEERGGTWNYNIKSSFIEIYNEDLIDLLTIDDAIKREVQIREDKDGHIIWGGLREVNVKNAGEVMSLLKKGTAIRRTNETDMNAQSSRSHAIFSLTFTQKKYTGSGAPPRSSSPHPPGGRSPSRLARPGSMYATPGAGNRVSSPTFGRPSTPSFASAMGRGGLRPASALGHAERSTGTIDEDGGEWVTIVSKFHFVDLAGSERLKRTAAAGERIKEGISINSGLLALGNVISALGDPSRAKSGTASYVPYRDSKLTRLLQDSLGGNAHTLMIACVSSAEWNAAETINTLKYANRARNIKNRAIINEKEDGWDDIEWLQGTVTRLRKELKGIKEGGPIPLSETPSDVFEGSSKKVLAQMTELQSNYEDLREKFVERTEELTRLRRDLGEKHRTSGSGAIGGTAKYEEIVGPVIEEYEKTISAMEAELSLNKAALRHTNEMFEEKEEELAVVIERHTATELYMEELRSRVAKLNEREASTEAYLRDLEEQIKAHEETSMTSSESMSDLKRELGKYKDTESQSAKYIFDLEQRLSQSNESVVFLQQSVEKLEAECDHRRGEVESLQGRLEAFRRDGESWRSDLEAREQKLKQLEERLIDWEKKKQEAGEARVRLGGVVEEVVSARRSLEIDLANAPVVPTESSENSPDVSKQSETEARPPSPSQDADIQSQLLALQQTHTATLADLSSVTSKYRDALREISDLAAQIQEAKLNSPSIAEASADSPMTDKPPELPLTRRRMTSPRVREPVELPPANGSGRRLFFRQAASAESLHARSLSQSQSLSQELSSVHLRKASFSSHGTSSSHSPSNSHSHSYSHSAAHSLSLRPNLSISMPSLSPPGERSVSSLEKEIMRLQEVLKEREAEITALEESLKEVQQQEKAQEVSHPRIAVEHEDDENQIPDPEAALSPKTLDQFDHIRKTMENGHIQHTESGSTLSDDESLERLNELMLSMAQKESQHREIVDDLNNQLTQTRRQLDDLTMLSRDQTLNMSSEIAALQRNHAEDLARLEEVTNREVELMQSLKQAQENHKIEIEALEAKHQELLDAKLSEAEDSLDEGRNESVSRLQAEFDATKAELEKARRESETAIVKLQADHDRALEAKAQEIEALRSEHEKALQKLQVEHAAIIRQTEEQAAATLQTTEEEYYNALTKLRGDHAEAIKTIAAETNATIERLREEHAGELRIAEIAKEGSISESESARTLALKSLQDEHAAAISRKEAAFTEEIENLNAGFLRKSKAQEDDYALRIDRLKLENETHLSKLKSDWCSEVERLNNVLTEQKNHHDGELQKLRQEKDAAVQAVQEQQALVLQELERGHEEDFATIKSHHSTTIQQLADKHAEEHKSLLRSLSDEVSQLKAQHEQDLADLHAQVSQMAEKHQAALADVQAQHKETLAQEQLKHTTALAELEATHAATIETMQKDREALVHENESYKVAAEEFTLLREQTRQNHEAELGEKDRAFASIRGDFTAVVSERDDLQTEVDRLRAELDRTRNEQSKLIQEASKRESLVIELERHRSVLADLQENLQKVKDEKDVLQLEKNRSDSLVRDLQAQLARSASPPNARSPDSRNLSFQRGTNLPGLKLPPPTPPPSIPPPPAPRSIPSHLNGDSNLSTSSQGSSGFSSNSSKESQPESPSTSVGHLSNGIPSVDTKVLAKLDQQTKLIDEQEAMIKTLNKQLTHCESDLQTHMDLVANLETSLGDSEKNLRKARMQATELARERDTLNVTLETLRNELGEAKREVATVRRSIVEEKHSLEQRLDEERKAKERVRQQLDSRMEELQKRKSKFACL